MKTIKWLASNHPLAFSLVITFIFILMLIISALLSARWPGEGYGNTCGTIARTISIAVLIALLVRLGWLRPAGFTRIGNWQTWLILLLPLAYAIAVTVYAFKGNFDFRFSGPRLTAPVFLFIMASASLEEVTFRGLILYGLARVWGSTNRGLLVSVLVSSLLFGGIHILDFLSGRPLPNVLLLSLEAISLGIFLGSLVLNGKSIYPAVFFHGAFNLAAYLLISNNSVDSSVESWLYLSLLMVPLALFGIYIQGNAQRGAIQPSAAAK